MNRPKTKRQPKPQPMNKSPITLVITRRRILAAIADHVRYVAALQRRLSSARDDGRDSWLDNYDDDTIASYQILCEAMAMRMRRYLDIAVDDGAAVASHRIERLRSLA